MKFRPRVTSAAVVGAPAPAPPASTKCRCRSCGVGIPRRKARPFICSYCAGDPRFGTDGYFADMIADEITMLEQLRGEKFTPAFAEGWRRDLSRRAAWESGPFNARRAVVND